MLGRWLLGLAFKASCICTLTRPLMVAWVVLQDLQPQLIKTVGEVEALMVRIAKEKAEVVQPKAAAVAVDEAAAQAKVHPSGLLSLLYCSLLADSNWTCQNAILCCCCAGAWGCGCCYSEYVAHHID